MISKMTSFIPAEQEIFCSTCVSPVVTFAAMLLRSSRICLLTGLLLYLLLLLTLHSVWRQGWARSGSLLIPSLPLLYTRITHGGTFPATPPACSPQVRQLLNMDKYCSAGQVVLLAIVHSAAENSAARSVIRSSWGRSGPLSPSTRIVFLLGRARDTQVQCDIISEPMETIS